MDEARQLDPPDAALAAALREPVPGTAAPEGQGLLTVDELANRAGTSAAVIAVLEREGFLIARDAGERRFATDDAEVVAAGLGLVAAGVPLGELLDLARRTDAAMRPVADAAVEVFLRFVRDPVRATASDDEEAADRLVDAFQGMLPATGRLLSHHFQRLLLVAASERVAAELAARAAEDDRP